MELSERSVDCGATISELNSINISELINELIIDSMVTENKNLFLQALNRVLASGVKNLVIIDKILLEADLKNLEGLVIMADFFPTICLPTLRHFQTSSTKLDTNFNFSLIPNITSLNIKLGLLKSDETIPNHLKNLLLLESITINLSKNEKTNDPFIKNLVKMLPGISFNVEN